MSYLTRTEPRLFGHHFQGLKGSVIWCELEGRKRARRGAIFWSKFSLSLHSTRWLLYLVVIAAIFTLDVSAASTKEFSCFNWSTRKECNQHKPNCKWQRPISGGSRECLAQPEPVCTSLKRRKKCAKWPHCSWSSSGAQSTCVAVSSSTNKTSSSDVLTRSLETPNILLILVDDWRDVRASGLTPNIDQLRESATSFSNAFAQFPQCGPSRTSLLTGQYPFTSGNFGADLFNPSFRNETHLHQFLRHQGYLTAVAGKVFHARSSFYPSSWFDRTDADDNPKLDTQWPFNVCKNKVKTCSCIEGDDFTESSCRDFLTAQAATRWMIEWETESRPWFISVGLIRPHADYRVPDRIDEGIKLDWTRQVKTGMPAIAQTSWGDTPFMNSAWHTRKAINSYAAAVHYADDLIGTMLSTLESSGQLEDTAIILTSDHGMHLSDDFDHFGKWTLQDASLRVPFIFKPPRELNREAGVERDDLIELVDIFPTIADLAGFSVSDVRLDGTSVLARMQGAADDSVDSFAVSVLTICDGGRSAARHLPCTTKLRGGTDVDAVAYSIRTKRERRTEYRKLVISSENCKQKKTIEACTSSPGCMWSWWYIYKDAAQNHDYFCIANPGLSSNIDWSAEGLLGVELYDVLYDPMLNLANETFSENYFRSLLESVGI